MFGPPTSEKWFAKRRYHHGDLRNSALLRGREIVARHGPTALSLRGLARDLGVTATALTHRFGSIAGLRAAVAAVVTEQLQEICGVVVGTSVNRRTYAEIAEGWVAFAASNPNLYLLASGEGWHRQGPVAEKRLSSGWLGAGLVLPSPRRVVERGIVRQSRRYGKPEGDVERGLHFASALHGLALARLDGVPPDAVARGVARAIEAMPA
jgi:AcrR family transcriptional regulator